MKYFYCLTEAIYSFVFLFQIQSSITSDDCIYILTNLTALHNFLMHNTQLSAVVGSSSTTHQHNPYNNTTLNVSRLNHTIQDAQLEERQSLDAFKTFVCHCCQVLGLWRILCEHQFHTLVAVIPESHQQILQNTIFKDLFLYRQDMCLVLITALVDSYLGDNASVDSISAKLREVCPHLYRTEDAAYSKVFSIYIQQIFLCSINPLDPRNFFSNSSFKFRNLRYLYHQKKN